MKKLFLLILLLIIGSNYQSIAQKPFKKVTITYKKKHKKRNKKNVVIVKSKKVKVTNKVHSKKDTVVFTGNGNTLIYKNKNIKDSSHNAHTVVIVKGDNQKIEVESVNIVDTRINRTDTVYYGSEPTSNIVPAIEPTEREKAFKLFQMAQDTLQSLRWKSKECEEQLRIVRNAIVFFDSAAKADSQFWLDLARIHNPLIHVQGFSDQCTPSFKSKRKAMMWYYLVLIEDKSIKDEIEDLKRFGK